MAGRSVHCPPGSGPCSIFDLMHVDFSIIHQQAAVTSASNEHASWTRSVSVCSARRCVALEPWVPLPSPSANPCQMLECSTRSMIVFELPSPSIAYPDAVSRRVVFGYIFFFKNQSHEDFGGYNKSYQNLIVSTRSTQSNSLINNLKLLFRLVCGLAISQSSLLSLQLKPTSTPT